GTRERNPYHQVEKYRRGLIDFLSENSDKILSSNHENIDWSHLGAMIIFHKKIGSIKNKNFGKDEKWFHISDFTSSINRLDDLHSKKLNLNNTEINALLGVLGIDDSLI